MFSVPESSLSPRVRFGVFEVDLRAGELRKHGLKIKLHGRPFQILALLLEHPGEAVTRVELQEKLWPADTFVDFDHGLSNAVNKLREALGDAADNPRFVETLPRRGYRFIAPVEKLDGVASPAVSEPAPTTEKATAFPQGRDFRIGLAVLVLSAVVLAGGYFAWQRLWPQTPALGEKIMLAVLPFENLSSDPEQEYFADGMTVELITALGRLDPKRLGVIAPTSAMAYKGASKPIAQIRADLGVDYVLEGSVRREGERVRIAAQLVHTGDQTQLWSETYERELLGIFAVQTELANSIAASLAVEFLPGRQTAPARMPTTNAEAYEAFLKGRHFDQKGSTEKAVALFEQAIVHDPAYAPAYAGLANSLLFRVPAREFMPRAKTAALKALELDPSLPEAHAALGLVKLMYEWDWTGAEKTFRRALELNPADPETHLRYSHYLAAVGKLDEAIAVARRAQKLDPLAPRPGQIIGRLYTFAGQTDRAIEEYQKNLELHPNFYWSNLFLSFAYEDKGMYDQWFAYRMKAWRVWGVNPEVLAEAEKVYSEFGHEGLLRRMIELGEERARRGSMPSATITINYIKLGEKEKALYWLEKAFEHHTRDLIYLKVESKYDPLRSDSRFQELVHRMNFPE